MNELMPQANGATAFARLTLMLIAVGLAACSEATDDSPAERAARALGNPCGGAATISPVAASATIDGDPYTTYPSASQNWQSVDIDLGCATRITGVRRRMSRGTSTNRGAQGESVSYSADGITWTALLGTTTTGWGSYNNYFPHTWHSLPYGWSAWLRPLAPPVARFVRYHWDGSSDGVDEIDVETPTIQASRTGLGGTTAAAIIDRDTSTGFSSSYNNWQYVDIDFGRRLMLSGVRRHMSRGSATNRGPQGEAVEYSVDGVNWTRVLGADVTGWESYNAYLQYAWHSIAYGWSAWLRLDTAQPIRYLRYRWDDNSDSLDEIEIDELRVTSDVTYDFDPNDPSHQMNTQAWPSGPFAPPPGPIVFPDPSVYELGNTIGMTGTYDGYVRTTWLRWGVCSGGGNRPCYFNSQCGSGQMCWVFQPPVTTNFSAPGNQVRAQLRIIEAGGEVRGSLEILDPGLTYHGGGLCGDSAVAAGTQLPVRMTPWTHDGRFDEQLWSLGSRLGESHTRDFKRGTTSRAVDRFPISGDVQTTFTVAFQTRNYSVQGPFEYMTHTHLFGEVVLDTPSQCADGLLRLDFTRNDPMLMGGLGW